MADDPRWMRRALELAARGLGETNPNPVVGCVIVRGGRIVGEGFHQRAGRPHAEVQALARAGARAERATAYVSLEPCAHQGRTPPCAPLFARAGVQRVVIAMRDPNPLVNGRGVALLRRASITVETGILEREALRLNERFVVAAREARPFVLLKVALTLDGRIAPARGTSRWLTSPTQRRAARALRRLFDGVAVGIGTVIADDPLLLPAPGVSRPFHRVVFDTHLRLPLRSRLVLSARQGPVCVLHGPTVDLRRAEKLMHQGVRLLACPVRQGRLALPRALAALWREGLWSLMVEGGSELLGGFLDARLVDQIALFRAPLLMGGRDSLPAFGGRSRRDLSQALRLAPREPLWVDACADPSWHWSAASAIDPRPLFEIWYPLRSPRTGRFARGHGGTPVHRNR